MRSMNHSLYEITGGNGCDVVTGTSEFLGRLGRIYAIISNEDDSRIISWKYAKDAGSVEVTQSGLSYMSVKRVDTVTLTGTSGTATVTCHATAKTATYGDDLPDTASDFVTSHAADYLTAGIVVTANGSTLVFTSAEAGTDFTGDTTIVNATGDLAGTVAATTANSLFAINNNKLIYPDFPLTSITIGKGSFLVYYIL
jgi:hypothetical protein